MKVKAIKNFIDRSGVNRKIGDVWTIGCAECALKMIKEGKVKKVK